MKKILLIVGLICYSVISKAQYGYYEDALRFSQADYSLGSTARMQAVGGAQVSLGGDISSAVSNPAGLGFFNRNIFVVSPSLNFTSLDTRYGIPGVQDNGFIFNTFSNNFNFANIGTVINFNKGRFTEDKFKGGSLAISISRAGSYRLNRFYEGRNDQNSILDAIYNGANNGSNSLNDLSELEFGAYNQFLLDQGEDVDGFFYNSNVGGFATQRETVEEKGSHYQMNIAWGGNYDDRLYFGGGMGIQMVNYRYEGNYLEYDFLQGGAPVDSLDALYVDNTLSVRGAGINFNVGTIFRPASFMTLGISYTSPSFVSFDEESTVDVEAIWQEGTQVTEGGQTTDLASIDPYYGVLAISSYRLRSPSKLAMGASLFIGKNGFLTGDLEFVNHRNSTLNSSDFITTGDNSLIKSIYRPVMNVRVGGEYRIDNFMLRAGYAYLPSPYNDPDADDQTKVTFGFGYRTSDYFIDMAVVNSARTENYAPYFVPDNQPVATSDIRNTAVTLTFGLNF